MKLLSEEIKKIRKKYNLTQQELADKIFVTRQAVSKWECDKAFPSSDVINKIKEEFNIDLNELIPDEEIKISVANNNADIKRLKRSTKNLLILSTLILMIIIVFIFLSLFPQKLILKLNYKTDYASWNDIANSYDVYIDDIFIENINDNFYNINMNKVEGEKGSSHTLSVKAKYYNIFKKNALSKIYFIKIENKKDINISELENNDYFTDAKGNSVVTFTTKLKGLFKIEIKLEDETLDDSSIIISHECYDRYSGILYEYNKEYYFYIKQKEIGSDLDEDKDLHIDTKFFDFTVKLDYKYTAFKIKLIKENISIPDVFVAKTVNFKTIEYKYMKSIYTGISIDYSRNVLNTIFELKSNIDLTNKTLVVKADKSVYDFEVIVFDENENIVGYGYDYDGKTEVSLNTINDKYSNLNVCINYNVEFGVDSLDKYPCDIDFSFEITE